MKVIKKGHFKVMKGEELWVNTITDEPITVHIKDKEIRRDLYSKYVKVTFETFETFEELESS